MSIQKPTIVKNPRTDADVRLLMDRFSDLEPDGRLVRHSDIEAVLRVNRHHSTYKTAIRHWRKALMRERRIFLDGRSAQGEGFKALTADDTVRFAGRTQSAGLRIFKKSVAVAVIPRDSELSDSNMRSYRARLVSAGEQVLSEATSLVKGVSDELRPPRQMPRTAPAQ